MDSATSQPIPDDCVYIDLDDRRPWWMSLVGIVAVVVIAAVLVAPWVLDLGVDESDKIVSNTFQNSGSVCRPDASGLPTILDPTVDSWSRFCEWFIAP